ncbi:MAG TPA: ATP-binding protein [Phycisphaerales bacterium]|nr:ATP-binding protein [Phycisphaerales bacterium]
MGENTDDPVDPCGEGQLQDNFIGYNTITYSDPTDAHIVHAQAYTNNFGYSGSAAAQVAGIVAQVQGFTKQVFGIGMGPQICRQLIAGGKYEGRDRDGNPVLHPAPSVSTEEGIDSSCETVENLVDWDFCPGAGNLTGNLLDPRRTMVNVILNPIFDTPNIDTIMVVRGNRLMGNRYSVSAQDGNLFGIEGMLTSANRRYLLPSGVIGSSVRYPFGGDITDIYLAGDLQSAIPANDLLTIEIDPDSIPDPTADENLTLPSGRGLAMIKAFMDEVSINEQGNSVSMKRLNHTVKENVTDT